jgi:hypothetical protein
MLTFIKHSQRLFFSLLRTSLEENGGGRSFDDSSEYQNQMPDIHKKVKQDTFDLYIDIQKFQRTLKRGMQ